ncbi:MAG: hypothetical protein Q4E28_02485 [Clostridia bacterium]|nr:hypothetical protein [Clostridia bacterium]
MKRIVFISGHYGSGKTNFAVNLALNFALDNKKVKLADLDIVNPYFRSKDSEKLLAESGIELIVSDFANSNLDIPALPQKMYSIVDEKDCNFIVDVGGDERGALALGRISSQINENDYDMFLVVNFYRPLTSTEKDVIQIKNEIENACGLKFTGIVNNSNLGAETTQEDILSTIPKIQNLSEQLKLPVVMTCVKEDLYNGLKDKIENIFPLKLQKLF